MIITKAKVISTQYQKKTKRTKIKHDRTHELYIDPSKKQNPPNVPFQSANSNNNNNNNNKICQKTTIPATHLEQQHVSNEQHKNKSPNCSTRRQIPLAVLSNHYSNCLP